jgi:hypothetical protein
MERVGEMSSCSFSRHLLTRHSAAWAWLRWKRRRHDMLLMVYIITISRATSTGSGIGCLGVRHDDIGASSRHLWCRLRRTEPAGGNAAGALFEAE